jgi:hypothetical protein
MENTNNIAGVGFDASKFYGKHYSHKKITLYPHSHIPCLFNLGLSNASDS